MKSLNANLRHLRWNLLLFLALVLLGGAAVFGSRKFKIDAQQLLAAGYETGLQGRGSSRIGDKIAFDGRFFGADQPQGFATLGVPADQPHQGDRPPESRDVSGDISCAAQHDQLT